MPESTEKMRCVLFAPPGPGSSGDLIGDLKKRGWDPIAFSDAGLAMAELCLEDRTQSARTAWGLRPSRRLALVVAPSREDEFGQAVPLVDAVHRSLPSKVAGTAFVASTELTHKGDRVHFDAKSLRQLGRRYAEAYLSMSRR